MATSTIEYKNCTINGNIVSSGYSYTSYGLKFGRYSNVSTAVGSSSSPITVPNNTDTKLYETGALPAGTYMIQANIYYINTSNNGSGYRRIRLHYEYTDGSGSGYNIGQMFKPSPSGWATYVQNGELFWHFGKEVKLSVWGLQNSGQNATCYGYFRYTRI